MALNGLQKITDKIFAIAQEESDCILQEAQERAAQLTADYAAKAEAIQQDYEEKTQAAAIQLVSDAKAASAAQKEQLMTEVRQEAVNALFAHTLEQMRSLKSEQYVNLLVGLLCGALWEQLRANGGAASEGAEHAESAGYEVMMNPRERMAYGEDLIRGACNRLRPKLGEDKLSRLHLSKRTVRIENGFVLLCNGKEIDCSLEHLFKDIQEELGEAVMQTLFAPPRTL